MIERPLFVVGFPRSGTTLLRAMLGQHPEISMINEPELVWGLERWGMRACSLEKREDLLCLLRSNALTARHLEALSSGVTDSFLNNEELLSSRDIYERLLPRPTEGSRWGEKSLNNLFFMDRLWEWYPGAVIIHLVRDPRAAIASGLRKRGYELEKPTRDCREAVARQAILWSYWMQVAEIQARFQPKEGGYLMQSFEALIEGPEAVLSEICACVQLDLDPRMLIHEGRSNDQVLQGASDWAHSNLGMPLLPERARSAERLPDWFTDIIAHFARENAEKHGYCWQHQKLGILLRAVFLASSPMRRRKLRKHLRRRRRGLALCRH